jgi:hypothetical protein
MREKNRNREENLYEALRNNLKRRKIQKKRNKEKEKVNK